MSLQNIAKKNPDSILSNFDGEDNCSGVSIKDKLVEYSPKPFLESQEFKNWKVTESPLNEKTVQVNFSYEKQGFFCSLEFKKEEEFYEKLAYSLVILNQACTIQQNSNLTVGVFLQLHDEAVYTLAKLQKYGDVNSILTYYSENNTLSHWLKIHEYGKELDRLKKISNRSKVEFFEKSCF